MNDKRRNLGLGIRLLLFIIPISVGSLLAGTVFTGLYADRGVLRATTRLLSYKGDDFVRYANSQWTLLLENNLQNDTAYREGLRRSMSTYAASMLRSSSEWILAVDEESNVVLSVGNVSADEEASADARMIRPEGEGYTWIETEFAGEERVGYAFNLPAFGWNVYILDLRSDYFQETRFRRTNSVILIAITTVLSSVFVIFFIRRSLKPLKKVIRDMHSIVVDRDFAKRVNPVQNDEVGELAREFNLMSDYLDRAMKSLGDTARREKEARIEVKSRESETLEVLGRVSDHKDSETAKHTTRVGHYAAMISELRGDSEEEIDLMRWAVPLHDIGKVGIPDGILLKDGTLTTGERKIMENHVRIGYEILKDAESPILRAGADIAISHHERWDGSGYPNGLAGSDIPVRGRITGLVDVFDALTTTRPYKGSWTFEESVEYIQRQSGTQFDPEIVELFVGNISRVRKIMEDYGEEDTPDASRIAALT